MRATVLGIPNERFHPIVDLKLAQDELMQAAERRRRTYGVATPFDVPQYNMLAVSGGGENGAFGAASCAAGASMATVPFSTG